MQLVGIRDLKNRLAYYLGKVKKGNNIIVTDRGMPVAIIHNFDNFDRVEENTDAEERLAFYAKQGLITMPKKHTAFTSFKRAKVKGSSISETIIKERF